MNRNIFRIPRTSICVVFCMMTITALGISQNLTFAGPQNPPSGAKSLAPVTVKTLTELRATCRVEKIAYRLTETPQGTNPTTDGGATQGQAVSAIKEAFQIPVCQEWAYQAASGEGPRFPFAVEANERLVDALDKLKQNSNGFMQWMLLHERIVVTAQAPASRGGPYIMERSIRVEIDANTLEEALEQVEVAYNKQYSDMPPLLTDPFLPSLVLRGPPTGKFSLKLEGTLREVVLDVLDEMQDPALCYSLAELEMKNERFFALRAMRFDISVLDRPLDEDASVDEIAQYRSISQSLRQNADQRLAEYFSERILKEDPSGDKVSVGEKKR